MITTFKETRSEMFGILDESRANRDPHLHCSEPAISVLQKDADVGRAEKH